ncbi:MAG: hypothetical protein C0404_00730 [Verrucomicrobia bacterium]|nr:hypothetical protein [Verrucomicrobiota bacterium]
MSKLMDICGRAIERDDSADLRVFQDWVAAGKPIMSSSSMRYTKEFLPNRLSTHELGALRFVSMVMPKSWERHGIHSREGGGREVEIETL